MPVPVSWPRQVVLEKRKGEALGNIPMQQYE